jgi:hypothetical protein
MTSTRHTRTAIVAAADFPAYRRRILAAGSVIVRSAPVGNGYAVTTRTRGGVR